ncbi:hypothetical protein T10_202 [Trichinella papuae]|uniref:Uncharacterized protein n=1 Tax=Trichinella papuae TaxID=268474 RepID=A0A0V1N3V0_9BILA|nr:hypothetical protein T10_202 [Trichinella papuae]
MFPSNPGSNSAENGKRGRINGSEWVRSPEILTKLSDVEARFEHMCNRRPGAQYHAIGNLKYYIFQALQKESHFRNKTRQTIIRKCVVIRDYQIRYGSELVKRVGKLVLVDRGLDIETEHRPGAFMAMMMSCYSPAMLSFEIWHPFVLRPGGSQLPAALLAKATAGYMCALHICACSLLNFGLSMIYCLFLAEGNNTARNFVLHALGQLVFRNSDDHAFIVD